MRAHWKSLTLVSLPLLAIIAAPVALAAWDSSFTRVGSISSTTPTAGVFKTGTGGYHKVQCDLAAYIGQGEGATWACTTSNCELFEAKKPFYVKMSGNEDHISALCVAGTCSCQVFNAKNQ